MATTKTIGTTGRDYATLALYQSYLNGLGTLTDDQIGEMYNDSEFSIAGSVLLGSGVTLSGFSIIVRPAAGHGFKDNVTPSTFNFRVDQTKGVTVKVTGSYTAQGIVLAASGNMLLQGLQIYIPTATAPQSSVRNNVGRTSPWGFDGLLIECASNGYNAYNNRGLIECFDGAHIQNCMLIDRSPTGRPAVRYLNGTHTFNSVTILRPTDLTSGGSGILISYSNLTVTNCSIFGFATAINLALGGVMNAASDYNATDASSGFGSAAHNLYSKTFASQFIDVNDATRNWQLKGGNDLTGNGNTALTTDILGQTRSTPDTIGAFEEPTGGGGTVTPHHSRNIRHR